MQAWFAPSSEGKQFEDLSSQSMRVLAKRLAAYLPLTAVRQILEGTLPPPGTTTLFEAAILFSDISGFTRMAEALSAQGPRGAEELNRVLLLTFTALINAIHDAGGSVAHFHGDAMLVYFSDEDGRAAKRALACASFMQSLMQKNLAAVDIQRVDDQLLSYDLGIKIGVSYGRCCQLIVGDPERQLEYVLGGQPVDEAVVAEQRAGVGEVVAAKALLQKEGLSAAEDYQIVSESKPVPYASEPIHWHAYEREALVRFLRVAPAFIPPALGSRLQSQTTLFIAGHRSVTSLFVQFEGIHFSNGLVGSQLQNYFEWACDIVARFGRQNGRVNRILTGDKGNQIHILFGAPVAPDAPEQAIRCALALQREKPDYIESQRIGIATGAVFATVVGSQNRREYTAVGSVINMSARLTQHCLPDQIILNEQTARRAWQQFDYEPLPPVQLKGHRQAVSIYSVVGEQQAPAQLANRFIRWQKPPSGRLEEREQLRGRLETALAGQGGLLAISGPFGGGIRPLLAEGLRQWLAADGRVLAGICQPHLSEVPFAPWQSAWRDYFDLTGQMSPEEQATAVADKILSTVPNWADEAPLWLAAMGLPRPLNKIEAIAPGVRQIWLFTLIQRCLAESARGQPLLILLEDVQWADQSSLDLVAELAAAAADLPLLLVISLRPGEDFHFPLLNHPDCMLLQLSDWLVSQAREFARRRLQCHDLPLVVEQRLGLRDQNGRETETVSPLFLEESIKMMLSLDVLHYDEAGHGRVTVDEAKLAQLQVPNTISTLLQARLDAIPASANSLLQMAAVIGREFELELLVNLDHSMTWAEAEAQITILVKADLIQPVSSAAEAIYIFQHSLLHEVVYQSLPYARRQSIHLAVAERLKRRYAHNLTPFFALLAHHYTQADQPELGFEYALAAADEAAALFANRTAADLYGQALQCLQKLSEPLPQTAVPILLAQAQAYQLLGKFEQAQTAVSQAKIIVLDQGDSLELVRVDMLSAELYLAQGRIEQADILARSKINKEMMAVSPVGLAQALFITGKCALARFDLERADDQLRRARLILQKENSAELLSGVLVALGQVRFWLRAENRALSLCRQAIELAQRAERPLLVGQAMLAWAQIVYRQGYSEESLRAANEAIELVRMTSPQLLAELYVQRAQVHLYEDQLSKALSNLHMAKDLYHKMEDVPGLLRLYLLWGRSAALSEEDWETALNLLDEARALLAELENVGGTAVVESVQLRLGLARIAMHTKQWNQAETLLNEADAEATAVNLNWWLPEILYWQGVVKLALKQPVAAVEALLTALDAISAGGNPAERPLILLQLGLMSSESDSSRWHYLEKCITAANERAGQRVRRVCLQKAGSVLSMVPDRRLRQIGTASLAAVRNENN